MAGDVELVGLYWTVSGPVEVHVGREWSLFDWADRCAEAQKVGFSGLGIWHADLEHVLETRSLREMKQIFDDNGLRYLELEFLMDWFLDPDDERRQASDRTRALLFDAAAEFDAHHIKVGNIPGTPASSSQLTERFGELCADAAKHTDAKVVYEIMPFDVNVKSIDDALAVVGGAGAANGGIAIDTWHMSKLGIPPDELRRIPPEYLSWVELSDGQFANMDDPIDEVVNHRNLPGEGEFDIRGYIAACQDQGYPGPWGVEVLSEELRNNPLDVIFRRAYEATAAQFGPRGARREHTERSRGARPRPAGLDLHADAADPRVRGARQAHVPRAPGRDPRPHASRRRRRGVDRRVDRHARTRRPVPHDLPLPRLPARARDRPEGDDGRDLRAQGRPVQGHRRLDAPHRRLQRASSAPRGSSPPGSRTRPEPPGRRRSARRARSSCASSATAPPSRARSPRR